MNFDPAGLVLKAGDALIPWQRAKSVSIAHIEADDEVLFAVRFKWTSW